MGGAYGSGCSMWGWVEHVEVGGACGDGWSMWGVREVEEIVGIGGRDEMICVVGSE